VNAATVPPPAPPVPILFDRALTDVIRSRRMVEETERRLAEAMSILEALERSPGSTARGSWVLGLDEAVRGLTSVRETLQSLLDGV
jgi:hypothetical protein